jgi:hypothetical protein
MFARRTWPMTSFPMLPGTLFEREGKDRIRGQFISTVRGAAPTEGIELMRKRLPSRETAYWNSTVRAATIRVWKRAWGTPAAGSSCEVSIATAISFLSMAI